MHGRKEGVSTFYNKDGSKKLEANYRQDLLNASNNLNSLYLKALQKSQDIESRFRDLFSLTNQFFPLFLQVRHWLESC